MLKKSPEKDLISGNFKLHNNKTSVLWSIP